MESSITEQALKRARRLVEEAVAFYRRMPKTIALAEFSTPQGRFVRSDQYVYVLDSTGVMIAHPLNESLVGEDFYYATDFDGKSFIEDIVDTANARGYGWVHYKRLDYLTKTERPKIVYFEKTHGVIICSAVYQSDLPDGTLELPTAEVAALASPPKVVAAVAADYAHRREEPPVELVLDDAKRFVEEAIAFYRANPPAIALAEFSNPQGRFVKNKQYIFVLDFTGLMLAHGANQKYVGKNFYHIMDSNGKTFIKEIVDIANVDGYGYVEYRWVDPVIKTDQAKIVYFEQADGIIICSGIYPASRTPQDL